MTFALELRGASRVYGNYVALHPIDLSVNTGKFLAILRPSGSGKTTLLLLVGGFVAPTAGTIILDGVDITTLPIFARQCNTVFQDYALFSHLCVTDNIAYGLSVRRRSKAELPKKVRDIIATVGLSEFARRYPSQLSGGKGQRVASARAMICEPKVILLDEPLAALDAEMRHQMQDFLKGIQRQLGITFVFVTHDQQEAIAVADRTVVMSEGRIQQVASSADLYYRPATWFVAGFFGESNLLAGTVGPDEQVETTIGRFRPDGPANPGDCLVALRPETIVPGPATATGTAVRTIRCIVEDVLFRGSNTRVRLRPVDAPDLLLVSLVSSHSGMFALSPGDEVEAGLPASGAVVP